eukprot:TRINITY_DN26686_c0_g1_i13.p7 TRINITY_DN26686_c0_g1~~TRINITY_DN26686_c0_g1_i13.p7  ORF type:complete len:190 (+),score=13.52 TRINITY_DN26686_c0_g1_i13:335-904(+)
MIDQLAFVGCYGNAREGKRKEKNGSKLTRRAAEEKLRKAQIRIDEMDQQMRVLQTEYKNAVHAKEDVLRKQQSMKSTIKNLQQELHETRSKLKSTSAREFAIHQELNRFKSDVELTLCAIKAKAKAMEARRASKGHITSQSSQYRKGFGSPLSSRAGSVSFNKPQQQCRTHIPPLRFFSPHSSSSSYSE